MTALAELGVARISYGSLVYRQVMEQFTGILGTIAAEANGVTRK